MVKMCEIRWDRNLLKLIPKKWKNSSSTASLQAFSTQIYGTPHQLAMGIHPM